MGRVIRDFWVLTSEGIVLYERMFESKLDSQLFGALLSAINVLATSLIGAGTRSVSLNIKLRLKASLHAQLSGPEMKKLLIQLSRC